MLPPNEHSGSDAESERLGKRIARSGLASRREAEKIIFDGRVTVNGRAVTDPATKVTDADVVAVDGAALAEKTPPRLWRWHKPPGLVTTHRDEKGRETVFDRLRTRHPQLPRVISVGRLDLTSEGLLLLTNDGDLARHLERPATGWTRRYRARAFGAVDEAKLKALKGGITVDGVRYGAIEAAVERAEGANKWIQVAVAEGKNREVRKALEWAGLTVNRLIRVSYGPFQLGDLKREGLMEVKRKILRDQLGPEWEARFGVAANQDDTGRAKAAARPARPPRNPSAGPPRGAKSGGAKPGGAKAKSEGPSKGGGGARRRR